jgi:predicted RND superfamily exporter protein
MSFLVSGIIRHRKLVIILFIIITVLCAILQLGVTVNYNLIDYLPREAQSTVALDIMESEFDQGVPNARVMLDGVSIQQALYYKDRLSSIEGVSDVLWLDDVIDLKAPLETADKSTVENYYKDGKALISLTIGEGYEVNAVNEIYDLIGDGNSLSGNAVDRAAVQDLTGRETLKSTIILIPVILIILLISTGSYLEPILFLAAIGISVLINMGTNIFFGNISFITGSVSPILQMAVSLDYAIFLLSSFDQFRKQNEDVKDAMYHAMRRSFPTIAASAATTLFGFLALVFMRFRIGSDLGITLAKGIVLSFISVMVFLPALTLCSYKLIDRTKHKKILPDFQNISRIVVKVRIPALVLVALLIVPSFMAQSKNSFIYGSGELNAESRSGRDTAIINEEFGQSTAMVLLVPRGDVAKEQELGNRLGELPHVTEVVSYAETVGAAVPVEFLDDSVTSRFYSDNYSRIIVYTDTGEEGGEAFSVVEKVQAVTGEYYGGSFYSLGQSAALNDMKNVITKDNLFVNLLAIAAIFLVLLLTFRSVTLPIILLITIETAIWVNLSLPYFTGNSLCYIGFLIINTVQLGATVDYAILLTSHYMTNRKTLSKKYAARKTLGETFRSILISAAILSLAGFTLWYTSTNQIVSELGLLLGRGTIMSMLMVICFLPAALVLFDKVIEKTTLKSDFFKEK